MEPLQPLLQLRTLHQLYIAISLVTATGFLYYAQQNKDLLTGLHGVVSLWTGLAAFNYAYKFAPPSSTIYIDWILTTPLLVLTLVLTAAESRNIDIDTALNAMLLQSGVVLSGSAATALNQPIFFAVGLMLFLLEAYVLWQLSERPQYRMLLATVFSLWAFYPVVWYQGVLTNGLNAETTTLYLTMLALVSKHLYGVVDVKIVN